VQNWFRCTKTNNIAKWLAFCGLLAPLVLAIFIIIAALITPDYSHISDTVSQLGAQGRPHPEVMSAGFILYGLLISGLAYSLYMLLGRKTGAKLVFLFLAVYGIGVVLSGFFQDGSKAPGAEMNLESTLHSVFAMIGFLSLVVTMWIFGRVVNKNPKWPGYTKLSILIAILNLGLSLLFMIGGLSSVEGLLQRFFYLISLIWIGAVAYRAYQLARKVEV